MNRKKVGFRYVSLCMAALLLVSMVSVVVPIAFASEVTYQVQDDFEDGGWDYLMEPQNGNDDAITVLEPEFGTAQGNQAVRFEWEKSYYDGSVRTTKSSEIATDRADWERDVYETFYYYFPSEGFGKDSKGTVVKQWIAWNSDIPHCNKTFDLEVVNDVLYAHVLWNDSDNPDTAHPNDQAYVVCDTLPKDQWVRFDMHYIFDLDSPDGLVEIWMNDEAMLQLYDIQMGVGKSNFGPYAKYGPYVYGSSQYDSRYFYADAIAWDYEPMFDHTGVNVTPVEVDETAWYGQKDIEAGCHSLGEANTSASSTIEFDVIPLVSYFDGCIGYTDTSTLTTSYSSFNMLLRMNTDGFFDVRNGGGYTCLTELAYEKDKEYHVTIEADLTSSLYDVWVTPEGEDAVMIAHDYAFRTGAPDMDDIGQICLVDSIADNEFKVNNHTVNGLSAPAPGDSEEPQGGTTTVVPVKDNRDAIVSIVMDDGYRASTGYYSEAFETYDLRGSLALIYDWAAENPSFWQDVVDTGRFEVESHSKSHIDLTGDDVDEATLETEIVTAKELLMAMFPDQDVVGFVAPYNKSNGASDAVVASTYSAMRRGDRGYNSVSPSDAEWYDLQVQGVLSTVDESTMLSWIDTAVANKKWLIEMWHGVEEYDPSTYNPVTEAVADNHLAYISGKQEEGSLWVATFGEAIKYIREKQAAQIEEVVAEDSVTVYLTDDLDDQVFHEPLTLRTEVTEEWTIAYVAQQGVEVTAEVVEESDGYYVYYDAVPDAGIITIGQASSVISIDDWVFFNRTFEEALDDPFEGLSVKNKSNLIEIKESADGNHYMAMVMAETVTEDSHLDMDIDVAASQLVVQMDLSTSDNMAGGNLVYKDSNGDRKYLLNFRADGKVQTADYKTVAVLSEDEWTNLALVLDLNTATYRLYVDDTLTVEETAIAGADADKGISMLRLYLADSNEGGSALHMDNYRIYEGTEPIDFNAAATVVPSETDGLQGWYTTPVAITLTPEDNMVYSLDEGEIWLGYWNGIKLTEDGSYSLQYRHILSGKAVETLSFNIDSSAPTLTAEITGDTRRSGAYDTDVTIELTASDSGSGIGSVEYSLDGSDWFAYTESIVLTEDGNYQLSYRAYDVAGNVSSNTLELIRDTSPEVVGDRVFYSRTYEESNLEPFEGLSVKNKSNSIEIVASSDGNHYIHMAMEESITDDCHLDMAVEEAESVRYIVVQMDLSRSALMAAGSLLYKDSSGNANYMLRFRTDGKVQTGDYQTIATLSEEEWTSIALAIDFDEAVSDIYVDGELILDDVAVQNGDLNDTITLLRFYLANYNEADSDLCIDNLQIYEGTEPFVSEEAVTTDLASDIPGTPVLSNDNGYDTGLQDGNYQVTMNLWWGNNAAEYRLYENGALLEVQSLTADTPNPQSASTLIEGRINGVYEYYCELINDYGITVSETMTVSVTQANPGMPMLSSDNWDSDGDYTVAMNLWWGINGNLYRLFENGRLIDSQSLTVSTPEAQSTETVITGKDTGIYTYYCELINDVGVTTSPALVIEVK